MTWQPDGPTATGIGSWPGVDPAQACREVFAELGGAGLPFLPELPARGPGADLVGRGATFLVDLPVDLQPSGWRLVDRPGRDLARAVSMLTSDTDALAEVAEGHGGPLKVQVCGPWTLAGALWLPRGERVLSDPGACRDLVASLTEGVRTHLTHLRGLLPGAEFVVQMDEPGLGAALAGRLPTASGYGRTRPLEAALAEDGLRGLLAAVRDAGAVATAVHCCERRPPLRLLRAVGAEALSLDVTGLDASAWESLAVAVESGTRLWAGLLPPDREVSSAEAVSGLLTRWRRIGLAADLLARVDPTPTCGLPALHPDRARRLLHQCLECADALGETAG